MKTKQIITALLLLITLMLFSYPMIAQHEPPPSDPIDSSPQYVLKYDYVTYEDPLTGKKTMVITRIDTIDVIYNSFNTMEENYQQMEGYRALYETYQHEEGGKYGDLLPPPPAADSTYSSPLLDAMPNGATCPNPFYSFPSTNPNEKK